ncbi:hypothetical protein BSZ07_36230 [Streptomyces sp. M1013]|nr:hypothetical protein BSZ07_36230 [Streptomyces sp. M1013]
MSWVGPAGDAALGAGAVVGEGASVMAAEWRRRASCSLVLLVRASREKRSSMIRLRRCSGMIFKPDRYSLHTLLLSW